MAAVTDKVFELEVQMRNASDTPAVTGDARVVQGAAAQPPQLPTIPSAVPTIKVSTIVNGYAAGNGVVISGTADAGSTVNIAFNGIQKYKTAVADGNGAWSTAMSSLVEGSFALNATAVNFMGTVSAPSATVRFLVDMTAPVAPIAAAVVASSDNRPVITGRGEAGATVQLWEGETLLQQGIVNTAGSWELKSLPLSNGVHSLTAQLTDLAGNKSALSTAINVQVGTLFNISGTPGADLLTGSAAGGNYDAGAGTDTIRYSGLASNFTISSNGDGTTKVSKAGAGYDILKNIERIQFSDKAVALDTDGTAGQAFRIYQAAFDRKPDLSGLGYWISMMDKGLGLNQVAKSFIDSAEFSARYGNVNDGAFINNLYLNVLHRLPDQGGYDYWVQTLQKGLAREQVLAYFSESPENQAQVIGAIQNGFEFQPYI